MKVDSVRKLIVGMIHLDALPDTLKNSCTVQTIAKKADIPLGLQILAGANNAALSVALAAGFDFIRVEGFVFGYLADEGLLESDAGILLRFRKQISAENIQVWTDIKKTLCSYNFF